MPESIEMKKETNLNNTINFSKDKMKGLKNLIILISDTKFDNF